MKLKKSENGGGVNSCLELFRKFTRFGDATSPEWEKVWSRLSAQPFFSAHSAYFYNFRQKMPYFAVLRQKRVLVNCFATKQCLGMLKCEAVSLALCDSHFGSHWLTLPLFGILWPSDVAHYCSLISRIQSLIGSQGPCLALSAAATLTHFLPL